MVDAVITWVDGSDPRFEASFRERAEGAGPEIVSPKWRARSSYTGQAELRERRALSGGLSGTGTGAVEPARFRDNGELRYCLRSIEAFAPFIDRVILVTNGQRPAWLKPDHPRLRFVTHEDIFPDRGVLPTFNSSAIETNLHRIPGLSDDFVFFNDDFFLGRPVGLDDFRTPGRIGKLFVEASTKLPRSMNDRSLIGHCWAFNYNLIKDRFGDTDARMFAHTPMLYNRWLLQEVELIWRDEIEFTRRHPVRSPFDAHMRLLYTYYAGNPKQTLRAFGDAKGLGEIVGLDSTEYGSVRLGDERSDYLEQLARIIHTRPRFFCLNDEFVARSEEDANLLGDVVESFLQAYFPTPSSFEDEPARTLPEPPRSALSVRNIQVTALSGPDAKSASIWRRGSDDLAPESHPVRPTGVSETPIRPGDEVDIRADGPGPFELSVRVVVDGDGSRPLSGFPPDRRMRLFAQDGAGLRADVWIAAFLDRQGVVDEIERRLSPVTGRLLHDPMAGFLAADRAIRAGRTDRAVVHLLEQALAGGVDPVWVFHRLALLHLARREHYPDAFEAVRHALARNPVAVGVFCDLAEALAAKGEYGEALPVADALLASDRTNRRASFIRSLCRFHFNADDPEIGDLAGKKPDPAHLALWARVMRRRQEPAGTVLPVLTAAVDKGRRSFDLLVALAMAHEDAGARPPMMLAVSSAMDVRPSAETVLASARDCIAERRPACARLLLDALRSRMPWIEDGIVLRARLKIADGDVGPEVESELDEAIARGIDREEVCLAKADLLLARHRDAEALAALDALDPRPGPAPLFAMIDAARASRRAETALAVAGLVRSWHPHVADGHVRWAEVAFEAGASAEGIDEAVVQAREAGASPAWAGPLRVKLALRDGRLEALPGIVAEHVSSEDEAAAFVETAEALRASGSREAARALLDAVALAAPDHEPAVLGAADLAAEDGRDAPGLRDAVDQLVATSPDPYPARLMRFRLALAAGEITTVVRDLRHLDEHGGDVEPFLDALERHRGLELYEEVTRRRFDETGDDLRP